MSKKTLTIILALVLFGCFFLPYLGSGFYTMSGFDAVFKTNYFTDSWIKYFWLLIPVSAVLLLLGAAEGKYFISRNTLVWIPLLTILFILVNVKMDTRASIGNLLEGMGYGFWISLATSIMLAFYNPKGKK